MGRRVKKAIYAYGSGGWQVQKEILFVYDGWNLIQEKEVSGTGDPLFDKFYVWGLDLSQSIQGAGGIGGLVCRVSGGEVRHYFYDGNGNVGQMVDPADGAITARYEFDPYGKIVAESGTYAGNNPFRFSTKYHDDETGLVYYGFRYYFPELDRWINRDELEEFGGFNLYGFAEQNPINYVDPFGLQASTIVKPGPSGLDPSAHPVFQSGTYENKLIQKDIEKIGEFLKDTFGLKGWAKTLLYLSKIIEKSKDDVDEAVSTTVEEQNGGMALYHYTDLKGLNGILASQKINPSIPDPAIGGKNAAFGEGQYFTGIPPELVLPGRKSDIAQDKLDSGFMSIWQLAEKLYTTPWKKPMVEYFLEINVEGLIIENPRIFVYLHRTACPLDISDRLIRVGLHYKEGQMIKLAWLPDYFNNNLYDGLDRINKLKWDLSINYDKEHKVWGVAGGEALIYKTDSKEALESFLYGMGLAYNVFPDDIFEQLKKNIEDL